MFRNSQLAALAAAASFAFAGAAQAVQVVGATRIEITSAVPTWIQLDEVEAIEFGSLTNVAASANGGSASAVSFGFGGLPAGAIDGLIGPLGYHSGTSGGGETLTLTLAHAANLTSLRVFGHIDFFAGRNLFNYAIYNAANDLLASGAIDATTAGPSAVAFEDPPTGAVPEPATWAMMILGFGAVGSLARSRRRMLA